MKKILFVIFSILITCSLYAKSLVYIPTAVSCDGVFTNYFYNTDASGHDMNLKVGINGFEVEATNYSNQTDEGKYFSVGETVFGGQWQILPEVGLIPAIAIGAKDISGRLAKSPAFYGVATKDFSNYIPLKDLNKLAVTIGMGNDSLGFFGGLDLRYSFIYGSFEAYKKGVNYSCGLTFLDDCIKVGYKRFNKNNYFGAEVGFALNF